MGKFLETKDSGLQNRVIKKLSKAPGKSIHRSTTVHERHVIKEIKRKPNPSKEQEPPPKKLKTENRGSNDETEAEIIRNENKFEFQDLKIEVKTNRTSNKQYLKILRHDEDLFADDELKARYNQFTNFNFIFHIFDEIALEGLDGITIEAFWKRLNIALKFSTCIDYIEEMIWHVICANKNIKFYKLPEPRGDLVILNRDAFVNKETNTFMEVYQTGPDIYEVKYLTKTNLLWGSCATLSTRTDISAEVRCMSLDEAYSTYKNRLVMVANQALRTSTILDDLTDPNYEYTNTEYCLLERIGRARELGEITQGPAALGHTFGMDSKSVYHYCKRFAKENLVIKQFFCVRSTMDQNKIGRLLQLRRFYGRKKSKYMILAETIINYLKKCTGYRAPYSDVKALFSGRIHPKFFKNQEFLRFIKTQIFLPYKELYPTSTYKEYMTKGLTKERTVQVMQLKDPYVNILASWSDSPHPDSSDDEDENDGDDSKIGKGRLFNMEIIREIYLTIHATGTKGCTTLDINNAFDIDFATTRSVLKKLVARQLIQCRKIEMGRQKTNKYVASCHVNSGVKISQYIIPLAENGSNSVLERLKEKQRQKIDSLEKGRVYTQEQFEADQQFETLDIEKPSLLPVSFTVPQIVCEYLISKLIQENIEDISFLAEFTAVLKPFKINLTYPKIKDGTVIRLRNITSSGEVEDRFYEFNMNISDFFVGNFKPDYLTKAYLLQAHFSDKTMVNSRELLEPDFNKSKHVGKRARPGPVEANTDALPVQVSASTSYGDSSLNTKRIDLASYMGPNPVLISKDEDDSGEVVAELYMSTLPETYKTGNITNYVCPSDVPTTERVLSRIQQILNILEANKVFEEVHKLLREISKKEFEEGYNKKIDRKSLHRIIIRLVKEGYVKVYQCIVSNKSVKKSQNYICHPEVDHNHQVIRNGIDQIKFRFFCGNKKDVEIVETVVKKPKPDELSPFGEDDVLQSIQEINELHPPQYITIKAMPSKKAGKLYGYRPKFARMSLLHEILFYLIYVLDKNTKPITKVEVLKLFRIYKIDLTEEDFQQLPPIYCKEISWKMFIPPLPRHQGWDSGWALICDVILRIPLTLIARLYCINFLSTELQEILQHHIKRFYLIKNFPSQIRHLVMYKRKYIHDIHFILVRLAYCGVLQFGPSRYKEKDQGFIYLNRKASLLETMTSDPGYHKVTDKIYNRVTFYFESLETVGKYWFTMHSICINTLLNARHVVEGKTVTIIDVSAKPSLNRSLAVKMPHEVKKFDNGEIPGDNRGAAGLDTALWSHIQKNWVFYAPKSPRSFMNELALLKLDVDMSENVAFQQLKLPPMAHKFYLSKPQEMGPIPSRNLPYKKTAKKRPVVKKVFPLKWYKPNKKSRNYYDAVDRAIMKKNNGYRFRPSWSKEEDRILILLKIAVSFLSADASRHTINYVVIRDVLHKICPESRNKNSRSLPRRLKILMRDVPLLSNIPTLIQDLCKLVTVTQYFMPLRNYIINGKDDSGRTFKLSELELQNAFIFLSYYILTHRNEVETAINGNLTTVDYLNDENLDYTVTRITPVEKETKFYTDPSSLEDIRKYVLKNIIHSALGHKQDQPAWSYQTYRIYQKFSQDVLKNTINELRGQHMISLKKTPLRKFFTPYKFSLSYIFNQTTTFPPYTMDEAYATFMDLKNAEGKLLINTDLMETKKYGQMFALNEVITFMISQTNLKFWIPEHHFILNPDINDHSPVIDELARRYQAKIKNDQKDVELQDIAQPEFAFDQIPGSEPLPSTSIVEDSEILQFDDEEPLDLTITSTHSTTITNLKHWISDCIDAERVRSPSPELLNLDVSHVQVDKEKGDNGQGLDDGESGMKEETVLSLEEIKEEMVKITSPGEKRKVPYITDIAKLLSENFEEIDTDEQIVDEMKKHFVQQYPRLEELAVEGFNNHYLVEFLVNRPGIKEIWERVEREAYVVEATNENKVFDDILEKGGTMEDIAIASELISFVYDKDVFGATGPELQERFNHSEGNCSLEYILNILTSHHILMRTGVYTIVFIHHNHQKPWLADTFNMTDEYVNIFKRKNEKDRLVELEQGIEESLQYTQWMKVKTVPWVQVDGSLDKELFKVWLASILSYCIENPKLLLQSLFSKFCFIKPVDLYYLVEILQELGCLEMRRFQSKFDLFSDCSWIEDSHATVLDRFEDIYLEPNQISFCLLGYFFHKA